MAAAPLIVSSLRGGLNEEAPIALADNQCTIARNLEWVLSPLGERRRGSVAVDLTGTPFGANFTVLWVHRHLPTQDLAAAQLWVMALRSPDNTVFLAYKDTSWHTVSMPDVADPGVYVWHVNGQTLHGKLFIAYPSAVNRLHVWDNGATALRRTGLAGIGVPPGMASVGSGGAFSGVRYYRIRFTRQVSGVTKVRSEPSPVAIFTPPGTGTGASIGLPAVPGESETHWEVEASSNNADFYRIGTVAITTGNFTDTNAATAYPNFPLSEDVGDYSLQPSFRYLAVDGDRLLGASSFSDPTAMSRLYWTPVAGGTGVGNDERLALDQNPYLDLDNFEGGDITNLSNNVNGYNYVTKWGHIYQIARTGVKTSAYEAIPLTKQRGAAHGTLVEAFSQAGKPFLFALDPDIGPIHIGGVQGIAPCGLDLLETWQRVYLDAVILGRGIYYPEKQQVHWWVATGTSIFPNEHLVLHVNLMRPSDEGSRGGFAVWDGPSANYVISVTMFADNINAGGVRSRQLKPVIARGDDGGGASRLVWQLDTGDNDVGTPYYASVKTKPFARSGLLDHFEAGEGQLMVRNANGALVDVVVTGMRSDKSLVTKTISAINLTQKAGEGVRIIRSLDNLSLAELQTIQIEIKDTATASPGPQWQLELLSVTLTGGQSARQR